MELPFEALPHHWFQSAPSVPFGFQVPLKQVRTSLAGTPQHRPARARPYRLLFSHPAICSSSSASILQQYDYSRYPEPSAFAGPIEPTELQFQGHMVVVGFLALAVLQREVLRSASMMK